MKKYFLLQFSLVIMINSATAQQLPAPGSAMKQAATNRNKRNDDAAKKQNPGPASSSSNTTNDPATPAGHHYTDQETDDILEKARIILRKESIENAAKASKDNAALIKIFPEYIHLLFDYDKLQQLKGLPFENAKGDIDIIRTMYYLKMAGHLADSNYNAAIQCHDSLSSCFRQINFTDDHSFYNELIAAVYFKTGNYASAMPYFTSGPKYALERRHNIYKTACQYWDAYGHLPAHQEYLDSIKTLCKLDAYNPDDYAQLDMMSAMYNWCEVELGHFANAELLLTAQIEYYESIKVADNKDHIVCNNYYYRALERYKTGKFEDALHDLKTSLKYKEPIGAEKINALIMFIEKNK